MRSHFLILAAVLVAACSGADTEQETYCKAYGGLVGGTSCVLMDCSTCTLEAFYARTCGADVTSNALYSYCVQAEGRISFNKDDASKVLCTLPEGTACDINEFFLGNCGPAYVTKKLSDYWLAKPGDAAPAADGTFEVETHLTVKYRADATKGEKYSEVTTGKITAWTADENIQKVCPAVTCAAGKAYVKDAYGCIKPTCEPGPGVAPAVNAPEWARACWDKGPGGISGNGNPNRPDKIWICHGTAAGPHNPYRIINVDPSAISGHIDNVQHNVGVKRADVFPGNPSVTEDGVTYLVDCACNFYQNQTCEQFTCPAPTTKKAGAANIKCPGGSVKGCTTALCCNGGATLSPTTTQRPTRSPTYRTILYGVSAPPDCTAALAEAKGTTTIVENNNNNGGSKTSTTPATASGSGRVLPLFGGVLGLLALALFM